MVNVIEFKNITQIYKDNKGKEFLLFDNLSFAIEDTPEVGQFASLMGSSGCGKTTLLRYLTQLQKPTSGEILINGEPIHPGIIIPMVFQEANTSTLPWYSVLDNIALPLLLKGVDKKKVYTEAMEMIKIVGLDGHEKKYAKQPILSGGQLQRVSIARSLVVNPNFIVMDEPFSALDSVNRRKMQVFLIEMFKRAEIAGLNPTILMVTHDEREAVFLSDEIFILGGSPSKVKQHFKINFAERNSDLRNSLEFINQVKQVENAIN
jgi:NitT/TauT family transport system ATP-binding protein